MGETVDGHPRDLRYLLPLLLRGGPTDDPGHETRMANAAADFNRLSLPAQDQVLTGARHHLLGAIAAACQQEQAAVDPALHAAPVGDAEPSAP